MCNIAVAPLVGAWIEIANVIQLPIFAFVAPLVGAWIEIDKPLYFGAMAQVAPLVGAWIEIIGFMYLIQQDRSLLSWERGLK